MVIKVSVVFVGRYDYVNVGRDTGADLRLLFFSLYSVLGFCIIGRDRGCRVATTVLDIPYTRPFTLWPLFIITIPPKLSLAPPLGGRIPPNIIRFYSCLPTKVS